MNNFGFSDLFFFAFMGIGLGFAFGILFSTCQWQDINIGNNYNYQGAEHKVVDIEYEKLDKRYNQEFSKISLICRKGN